MRKALVSRTAVNKVPAKVREDCGQRTRQLAQMLGD
jgi:hypothetical protein